MGIAACADYGADVAPLAAGVIRAAKMCARLRE
jgi:hypothetical protein